MILAASLRAIHNNMRRSCVITNAHSTRLTVPGCCHDIISGKQRHSGMLAPDEHKWPLPCLSGDGGCFPDMQDTCRAFPECIPRGNSRTVVPESGMPGSRDAPWLKQVPFYPLVLVSPLISSPSLLAAFFQTCDLG